MPEFPNLRWFQAKTFSIQISPPMAPQFWGGSPDYNPLNNSWHAGRVNDVLALDYPGAMFAHTVLAATDTGGVWEIYPPSALSGGDAVPLSDDWDNPDVACLASDHPSRRHIWAGCRQNLPLYDGRLFEAFVDGLSLDPWTPIAMPAGTGSVWRVAITSDSRRIVVACDGGLLWSVIPERGGVYQWSRAEGLPPGAYYGAAIGRDPRTGHDTVAVGVFDQLGDPNANGASVGIYAGSWQQGSAGEFLGMRAPAVEGLDRTRMTSVSIASCRDQPEFMYAISRDGGAGSDGHILGVVRSDDGGQSWTATSTALLAEPGGAMTDIIAFSGGDEAGGRLKTISVSPTDSRTVAFGWEHSVVSPNGGDQWFALGPFALDGTEAGHQAGWEDQVHPDIHAIYFDPVDVGRLYIASDGGIAMTTDGGGTFTSIYNMDLRNLQFYSTGIWRQFIGRLAPCPRPFGLVAGGTQDNGNVYTNVPRYPTRDPEPRAGQTNLTPWVAIAPGDGGLACFIGTGQLLQSDNCNGQMSSVRALGPAGFGIQLEPWNDVIVPVRNPRSQPDASGIIAHTLEAVRSPAVDRSNNAQNAPQLMYALGAPLLGGAVFGLFALPDGSDAHWEQLAVVPVDAEAISALWSRDGSVVFVGTTGTTRGGRLFALLAADDFQAVQIPTPSDDGELVQIPRIVDNERALFVAFNRHTTVDGRPEQVGRILRYIPLADPGRMQFQVLEAGLQNNRDYFAMELAEGEGYLLAATDKRVVLSQDGGDSWQSASQGLPARPHCSDLRFVDVDGVRTLYLSTWGRSLWLAPVNIAEYLPETGRHRPPGPGPVPQ
jgi:hypothetical protein